MKGAGNTEDPELRAGTASVTQPKLNVSGQLVRKDAFGRLSKQKRIAVISCAVWVPVDPHVLVGSPLGARVVLEAGSGSFLKGR
jgi:hypothetical protein